MIKFSKISDEIKEKKTKHFLTCSTIYTFSYLFRQEFSTKIAL